MIDPDTYRGALSFRVESASAEPYLGELFADSKTSATLLRLNRALDALARRTPTPPPSTRVQDLRWQG